MPTNETKLRDRLYEVQMEQAVLLAGPKPPKDVRRIDELDAELVRLIDKLGVMDVNPFDELARCLTNEQLFFFVTANRQAFKATKPDTPRRAVVKALVAAGDAEFVKRNN